MIWNSHYFYGRRKILTGFITHVVAGRYYGPIADDWGQNKNCSQIFPTRVIILIDHDINISEIYYYFNGFCLPNCFADKLIVFRY